jgi:hypothetical protein
VPFATDVPEDLEHADIELTNRVSQSEQGDAVTTNRAAILFLGEAFKRSGFRAGERPEKIILSRSSRFWAQALLTLRHGMKRKRRLELTERYYRLFYLTFGWLSVRVAPYMLLP